MKQAWRIWVRWTCAKTHKKHKDNIHWNHVHVVCDVLYCAPMPFVPVLLCITYELLDYHCPLLWCARITAKTLDTFASDRCQVDIDLKVFVIRADFSSVYKQYHGHKLVVSFQGMWVNIERLTHCPFVSRMVIGIQPVSGTLVTNSRIPIFCIFWPFEVFHIP